MFFSWGRHALGGRTKVRTTILRVAGGTSPKKKPVGGTSSGKKAPGSPIVAGKLK